MDLTSVAEPKLLNSGSSFFLFISVASGSSTGPRLFNKLNVKILSF